jgi:hypothetical protein
MASNFFNTWKVATEKDCSAEWSCGKPGEYFRCALCAHKFVPGDEFFVLYTNDLPEAGGNPILCVKEKGSIEEMRTAWKARCAEWHKRQKDSRFWFFRKFINT